MQYRYPGLSSFKTEQAGIFFGRKRETRELFHLISVEKTVVLFSKSGMGKSSLLNAGVVPLLLDDGLVSVPIRLGDETQRPETHFSLQFDSAWWRFRGEAEHYAADSSGHESFWQQIKRCPFERDGRIFTPVIIFDQFEELFTLYPQSAQRQRFVEELAAVIMEKMPLALRNELRRQLRAGDLSDAAMADAEQPPRVKFIFSIRSDMLHFMDELSEQIPYILRSRYQLFGLSPEQAREAIVLPAASTPPPAPLPRLREGERGTLYVPPPSGGGAGGGVDKPEGFRSPPFGYTEAALAEILAALSTNNQVESFQLQAVCQALEEKVIGDSGFGIGDEAPNPQSPLPNPNFQITPSFYGGPAGIGKILEEFYQKRLAELPEAEQLPARLLIEDGLINENNRRRSVDALDLLARPGVTQALLDALEQRRLLRREPRLDSFYYEISHDTLLAPILTFKKQRQEAEAARRRAEEEADERRRLQAEAERQKEEKRKIERARRRNLAFSAGALLLLGWALWQTWQAQQQGKLAEDRTAAALAAERRAAEKDSLANVAQIRADTAQAIAARQTELARRNAEATAQAMLRLGHSTAQVVDALVKEVNGHIYRLEYPDALGKLEGAARFDKRTPDFTHAALELAYYYNEVGEKQTGVLAQALALLGKTRPHNQADCRDYLRRSDPPWYKTLTEKYYPVMVEVPGGEYYPGCVKPGDCEITDSSYRARVDKFRLARTETTFHQYGLFCAASGRNTQRLHSPGWGLAGDNPVVNVHWYNAVEYANWLSVQLGFQPAYTIDSLQKDTNNLSSFDDIIWTVRLVPGANGFRLPTEAEWEWAARGGSKQDTVYFSGSDDIDKVAWYNKNSLLNGINRTHPVAGKQPNALGLFDMSGNVWEWCWDWYAEEYPSGPVKNWRGPDSGSSRVLRGGSWYNYDYISRVSRRLNNNPNYWNNDLGFRLSQGY